MLRRIRVLLIGASAGGLEALGRLAASLPGDLPLPLVAVLHAGPGRSASRLAFLAARSALPVSEAEDGQILAPPALVLAPPDYHLLLEGPDRLVLVFDEKVNNARPSIDLLFQSGAEVLGSACAALLLSGASSDGVAGLAAVRAAGGWTCVQAPLEASYPFMPRAAIEAGAAEEEMTLDGMAARLVEFAKTWR